MQAEIKQNLDDTKNTEKKQIDSYKLKRQKKEPGVKIQPTEREENLSNYPLDRLIYKELKKLGTSSK